MDTPPPTPVPDEAAAAAIVDALVPMLGIPMTPEWRGAVVANLAATAAAARLVLDFPLDDTVESAAVFRA